MITTPRLHLSIITMQDESAVFNTLNYQNTAEIVSMFTWPMTRAQSTWWRETAEAGQKSKNEYLFIARKNTVAAGCIGIHVDDDNLTRAEVGYWVDEKFQGQGIASEMLSGVLEFGFETLKLKEVYATTAKDNSASSHLLTKVGFKEDGTINVSLPDGATRPSLLFRRYKDA